MKKSLFFRLRNNFTYRTREIVIWFETLFLPRIMSCLVRGQLVLLKVENKKELNRALTYSTKEPITLDWLDELVKENDILYDIGANIGLYSLYLGKKLNGKCHIYAFEPEALNLAKLNINIHMNKLSRCIKAYSIALSSKNKISEFYINHFGYGEAAHQFGIPLLDTAPEHVEGSVGLTVDSLVYDYNLPCPNHLKIDVDGLEQDVVEGGKRVISNPAVRSVLVEVDKSPEVSSRRQWLLDFFSSHGFKLAPYEDSRNKTENLVFVKV